MLQRLYGMWAGFAHKDPAWGEISQQASVIVEERKGALVRTLCREPPLELSSLAPFMPVPQASADDAWLAGAIYTLGRPAWSGRSREEEDDEEEEALAGLAWSDREWG